jgi:hypothetical protein
MQYCAVTFIKGENLMGSLSGGARLSSVVPITHNQKADIYLNRVPEIPQGYALIKHSASEDIWLPEDNEFMVIPGAPHTKLQDTLLQFESLTGGCANLLQAMIDDVALVPLACRTGRLIVFPATHFIKIGTSSSVWVWSLQWKDVSATAEGVATHTLEKKLLAADKAPEFPVDVLLFR